MNGSYDAHSDPEQPRVGDGGTAGYRDRGLGSGEAEPVASQPHRVGFEFTGTARAYFRIWIVNVALSLVTFGIYSAWAKVRVRKYFAAHTKLAGAGFDYHADPMRVLKGRLIIVACFVALGGSQFVSMKLYLGLVVAFTLAAPWLLVQALKFNARNSSYRNIRFGFSGQVGASYLYNLVYGLGVLCSLGLFWPKAQAERTRWVVEGHAWGNRKFGFRGNAYAFIKPALVLLGAMIWMIVVFVVIAGVMNIDGTTAQADPTILAEKVGIAGNLFVGIGYPVMFLTVAYLQGMLTNIVWNHVDFGPHRFVSNMPPLRLAWLMFSGLVAAGCTVGLLAPWARIRLARFRAECLAVDVYGSLVATRDTRAAGAGAAGDAAADFGELDLDLGL